jgi:cobalt/nickel transport system ATP-binding protein
VTFILDIRDLNYEYPDGRKALQNICLQAEAGEKIALIGPNGAGKSTLLLHLNGILQGQGDIRVCGMELNHHTIPQVRGRAGLVFQSPDDQLFSPTVFEDVAYGPIYQGLSPEGVRERVHQALEAVQMEAYAGRSSYHLSIGEKKRVAMATVLSMQPEILVLDEPSAGLDPRARRALADLLCGLPHTLLLATHDLELVRAVAPRTVVLDSGSIAADGRTAELLSDQQFLLDHGLI